jgi:hypothetical protein
MEVKVAIHCNTCGANRIESVTPEHPVIGPCKCGGSNQTGYVMGYDWVSSVDRIMHESLGVLD